MNVLWRLVQYTRVYKYWVILGMVSMLISIGLEMLVPRIIQYTIDMLIDTPGDISLLTYAALGVIVVVAVKGFFAYWQRYAMVYMGQKVIYDLRNEFYEHLHELSFSYYDTTKTGELMSRATQDVETLRRFLSFGLINIFSNTLTFLIILGILLNIHWKMTLLTLAIVPVLLWVIKQFTGQVRPAFGKIQASMANLTSTLQENVTGMKVVKSFAREKHEEEKFHVVNLDYMEKNVQAIRLWAFYFPLFNFITSIGTVLVILYGGREVIAGRLTIGEMVAFELYLLMLLTPLRMVGWLTNLANRAMASAERIFQVLDTNPDIKDAANAYELEDVKGKVVFENVSFRYKDSERLILEDVSLVAQAGQTVALVGATGSGKSSFVHLIPRFYDPKAGRILVDGHDIRDVSIASLRSHIGIVLQETFLFSASIRANISYGVTNAREADIVNAAKVAGIHDFIASLPDGYDTVVGERGVGLSGGQKQRVAIARAILLNPRILILDDSTSSVDTETEQQIQKALSELMVNRTTFIIAQRLSTIKKADQIVVLDKGRVVERGRHQELLANSGVYKEIYQLQFSGQEEARGQVNTDE